MEGRNLGSGYDTPTSLKSKSLLPETRESTDDHEWLPRQLSRVEAGDGVASASEQPQGVARWRILTLAAMMMLTYFLGALSSQAATLCIPQMAHDLSITELQAQWIVTAYTLAYACGMLFAGRVADIFGRKICFVIGLVWFMLFSILCGVFKSFIPLCVLRAMSGLGMALAGPAGFGLVGSIITEQPARSQVFAAMGLGNPIGSALGTLVGGSIAGIPTPNAWSYLFFVLTGVAVLPLGACLVATKWDRPTNWRSGLAKVDFLGGLIITAAVSFFMFSLTQSGIIASEKGDAAAGWQTPYVPVLFVMSIGLFVGFMLWEKRLEGRGRLPPLVKVSLFSRNGYRITAMLVCTMFVVISVSGFIYQATLWYQRLKGLTPLENALHMLPCNLFGFVAALAAMFAISRVAAVYLIMAGSGLSGMCSVMYAVVPPSTNFFACEFIAQLLLPWGPDLVVCVGNVLIINWVDKNEESVGGALFQTSGSISAALGLSFASLIVGERERATGSLLTALRTSSWFNASTALSVVAIGWFSMRKIGIASKERQTAVESVAEKASITPKPQSGT